MSFMPRVSRSVVLAFASTVLCAAPLVRGQGGTLETDRRLEPSRVSQILRLGLQAANPDDFFCIRTYEVIHEGGQRSVRLIDSGTPCQFESSFEEVLLPVVVASQAGTGSVFFLVDQLGLAPWRLKKSFVLPGGSNFGVRPLRFDFVLNADADLSPGGLLVFRVASRLPALTAGTPTTVALSTGLDTNPLMPTALLGLGGIVRSLPTVANDLLGEPMEIPNDPSLSGMTFYAQAYALHPSAIDPVTFSNVLELTVR